MRYQHFIDELRVEASNRLGALLWGDDKPKKPKEKRKKQPKQEEQATVDTSRASLATDHATDGRLTKVIPLRRLA